MAPEENRAALRRWVEALNRGDLDGALEVLAPSYLGHFTGMPQPVQGPEGFKQMYSYFIRPAFPDQHITVEQEVVSGDKIAVQVHWTATHQGNFAGVPPTGRRIMVPGTGIFQFANGLIAEEWMQEDFLGIFQQLTQPSA